MYQYLILKNVVATYSYDEEVRNLHADILRLRFSSYRKYYGYQSIPADLFDFIGTHLVIMKMINGQYKSVLAYRLTTNSECAHYGQHFPYIGHMHATRTHEEEPIIHLASTFISGQREVGYLNAYAVDPAVEQAEKNDLIQRGLAFYAQYIESQNNLPVITAVTDRFKVYRDFCKMGFEYITGDDKTSTFTAPHIMYERFRSMVLKQQSEYALRIKRFYKSDYLKAINISCEEPELEPELASTH